MYIRDFKHMRYQIYEADYCFKPFVVNSLLFWNVNLYTKFLPNTYLGFGSLGIMYETHLFKVSNGILLKKKKSPLFR